MEDERVRLEKLRESLFALAQKDSASFTQVMNAYKIPKEDPARKEMIESALKSATLVPLETYDVCRQALEIEQTVLEKGKKNALSDIQSAVELARSAMKCAGYNVEINLKGIKDEHFVEEVRRKLC